MDLKKATTNYMNDGFVIKNTDGEEEIIHIPYNLNNVLVKESDIIQILAQYNVNIDKINHIEYFRQAFTHKSYCKKDIYPQNILEEAKNELEKPYELLELMDKSYERIEYFGDRVLKLIVSMYLFHRYPKQDEGFMTRLQTKLEDKKNLAIMSKEIGLSKFFIISRQIEMMNGRNLEKIHEDVFESFIGALFLSNGFEPCMFLIVNLLETLIDYSEKLYCDNNYKDQLLRIHHQNKWKFPQYVTIHFEGPPHKRKYIMGVERHDAEPDCSIEKRCVSFGIGSSKKEGEQNAAKMALIIHGILKQDQYSQADIYYPPWDKIATFDGETMIIKNDSNDLATSPENSEHNNSNELNSNEANLKVNQSELSIKSQSYGLKIGLDEETQNFKQDKSTKDSEPEVVEKTDEESEQEVIEKPKKSKKNSKKEIKTVVETKSTKKSKATPEPKLENTKLSGKKKSKKAEEQSEEAIEPPKKTKNETKKSKKTNKKDKIEDIEYDSDFSDKSI
jgi:ribonuclease-3